MIAEAFLTCALSLPAANFREPSIVSWQAMKNEVDRLKDWLRKNNPDADVFITPNGQEGLLKDHGWERVPFKWRDQEIWIQRKPKNDQRPKQNVTEMSA